MTGYVSPVEYTNALGEVIEESTEARTASRTRGLDQ